MGSEDDGRYFDILVRVTETFSIDWPTSGFATVGELVGLVSWELNVGPDSQIELDLFPSPFEIENAAKVDLHTALESVGVVGHTSWAPNEPAENLLPLNNRSEEWQKLSTAIGVKLPPLISLSWWTFIIFALSYCLHLALWLALLDWVLIAKEPTTLLGYFAAIAICLMIHGSWLCVGLTIDKFFTPRKFIPFKTVRECVNYIVHKKYDVYVNLLRRKEQVIVSQFIREVVADIDGTPIDNVGNDYRLWPLPK